MKLVELDLDLENMEIEPISIDKVVDLSDIKETNSVINPEPKNELEVQQNNNFDLNVAEYVLKNKPLLCILTPCYGGQCHTGYLRSLIDTLTLFQTYNIHTRLITVEYESLITRGRNTLIAQAMEDPKMTHMVFIDSDISWEPKDLLKLVLHDKPIGGGIYPKKKFHWDRLLPEEGKNTNIIESWIKSKESSPLLKHFSISNIDLIQNKLVDSNLNFLKKEETISIENNLIKVKHIATGFMMIQRNVIEKMIEAYPLTKYIDNFTENPENKEKFQYALFDCGIVDGYYLSEDWFFCDRWIKIGGSIYADITINLTHTGVVNYKGNVMVSMVL